MPSNPNTPPAEATAAVDTAQPQGTPPAERLEYLRGELRAERLSWGEVAELQGLAEHIDPSDIELLEAAGVPEHLAPASSPEHHAERYAPELLHAEHQGTPPAEHVEPFTRLGRYVAALMGANEEWDSAADYLEDIAGAAQRYGVGNIGSEAELGRWRTIADELGIEHDGGDEEENECPECGEEGYGDAPESCPVCADSATPEAVQA